MIKNKYYLSAFFLVFLAFLICAYIITTSRFTYAADISGTVCYPPNPQCGPSDCGVMVCDTGTISEINCPANGDVCSEICKFQVLCQYCYTSPTCASPSSGPSSSVTPTPSMTAVDSVVIVVTSTNNAPTVSSVKVTEPNYCFSGPTATITWTYSDVNNVPLGSDAQSAYEVQITSTGNFSSPDIDTGKILSGSNSYFVGSGLKYDTTYQARVRVWDSHDTVSVWSSQVPSWKPPQHAYPQVAFSWTPTTIHAKDNVKFSDDSTCYTAGGGTTSCSSWAWSFGDGGSATQQNPTHKYASVNTYNVNLNVTDGNNNFCSVSQPVTVGAQVPVWKEVSPN